MKKNLFAAFLGLVIFAPGASALNADSSWTEILGRTDLFARFPQVTFRGGIGKSIYSVCLEPDGTTLNGGFWETCTRHQEFSGPSYGRTPECVEKGLIALRVPIGRVPPGSLVYDIEVYNQYPAGPTGPQRISYGSPLFTKSFQIPACAVEGGGGGIGGGNGD